jgi:hypothetical protein
MAVDEVNNAAPPFRHHGGHDISLVQAIVQFQLVARNEHMGESFVEKLAMLAPQCEVVNHGCETVY